MISLERQALTAPAYSTESFHDRAEKTNQPDTTHAMVKVSAIVLAGGRGSRLGGCDKAWLPFGQRALIRHVLDAIEPQVDDIVISCNRNRERYRALGHSVVSDGDQAYRGPLAGISSAIGHCRHDWIQICPCDTPKLPTDLSQRLLTAAQAADASAAIPEDRHGSQYLCALINRHLIADAQTLLRQNQLSVKAWLAQTNTVQVDYSSEGDAFLNVNSPAQLRRGTPDR